MGQLHGGVRIRVVKLGACTRWTDRMLQIRWLITVYICIVFSFFYKIAWMVML